MIIHTPPASGVLSSFSDKEDASDHCDLGSSDSASTWCCRGPKVQKLDRSEDWTEAAELAAGDVDAESVIVGDDRLRTCDGVARSPEWKRLEYSSPAVEMGRSVRGMVCIKCWMTGNVNA